MALSLRCVSRVVRLCAMQTALPLRRLASPACPVRSSSRPSACFSSSPAPAAGITTPLPQFDQPPKRCDNCSCMGNNTTEVSSPTTAFVASTVLPSPTTAAASSSSSSSSSQSSSQSSPSSSSSARAKCDPYDQNGRPLDADTVRALQQQTLHTDWAYDLTKRCLTREFRLPSVSACVAMLQTVTDISAHDGHHCYSAVVTPRRSSLTVTVKTIALGGMSYNDLLLAFKVDQFAVRSGVLPAIARRSAEASQQ